MQVQPIFQKIINELAIDCDKFFDEVAELNEHFEDDEVRANDNKRVRVSKGNQLIGLSKRLFYTQLQKYGVLLDEDEKTLINTVFSL